MTADPELAGRCLGGSLRAADDPRRAASGAGTPAGHEVWSHTVCGRFHNLCGRPGISQRGDPVRLADHALFAAGRGIVRPG